MSRCYNALALHTYCDGNYNVGLQNGITFHDTQCILLLSITVYKPSQIKSVPWHLFLSAKSAMNMEYPLKGGLMISSSRLVMHSFFYTNSENIG